MDTSQTFVARVHDAGCRLLQPGVEVRGTFTDHLRAAAQHNLARGACRDIAANPIERRQVIAFDVVTSYAPAHWAFPWP